MKEESSLRIEISKKIYWIIKEIEQLPVSGEYISAINKLFEARMCLDAKAISEND